MVRRRNVLGFNVRYRKLGNSCGPMRTEAVAVRTNDGVDHFVSFHPSLRISVCGDALKVQRGSDDERLRRNLWPQFPFWVTSRAL